MQKKEALSRASGVLALLSAEPRRDIRPGRGQ